MLPVVLSYGALVIFRRLAKTMIEGDNDIVWQAYSPGEWHYLFTDFEETSE